MKTIGKYSIVKQVGAGAMGKVYQALDPDMNRQVALKVIKWSDTDDDAGRQNKKARLLKDARNAGSLLHPNIIAVYGFEQEGDTPFIVMEFVNGPTLKGVLGKDGTLDPKSVVRYLRQAADALDYAHRKGIIHRDIKPDNIMISEEGNVKIADFGISKVVTGQTSGHTLTQAGMVLGTPHYMSPEQVQGLTLDGRSDLFSLAVVAYQMLTAHRPFEAEEITAILYKIAFEEPERPELVNPALGSGVGKVLMRALAKRSVNRYSTCTEFAEELERALTADLAGVSFEPSMPTVAARSLVMPEPNALAESQRLLPVLTWQAVAALPRKLGAAVARWAAAAALSLRTSRRSQIVAGAAALLILAAWLSFALAPRRPSPSPAPAASAQPTPSTQFAEASPAESKTVPATAAETAKPEPAVLAPAAAPVPPTAVSRPSSEQQSARIQRPKPHPAKKSPPAPAKSKAAEAEAPPQPPVQEAPAPEVKPSIVIPKPQRK
ncbi:MAG: protein kinase [Bryobacteraceae bacterium]